MQKPTCFLPVEIIIRDLDPKIYVALKMAAKGHPSVIGGKSGVHDEMLFGSCDSFIFVDKGLWTYNSEFFRRIIRKGGVIVEIREEGAVYKEYQYQKIILAPYTRKVMRIVSAVYVWGPDQQEMMLENLRYLHKNTIPVSGHPTHDLSKPHFQDYYKSLDNGPTGIRPGYILINTKFGGYNSRLTFQEIASMNKNWDRKEWRDRTAMYHYLEKLFFALMETLKDMARRYPHRDIVIRPHPTENLERYEEIFSEFDNVHVRLSGSVRQWFPDALTVIHQDCSTGIEAFIAGKPVISYTPVLDEKWLSRLPMAVSERINDQQTLFSRLDELDDDPEAVDMESRDQRMANLKRHIANADCSGTDIIVDHISENIEKWLLDRENKIRIANRLWSDDIVNWFRKTFTRPPKATAKSEGMLRYKQTKFAGIELDDMKRRVDLMRTIEPDLPEVRVTEIKPDTFRIEPV